MSATDEWPKGAAKPAPSDTVSVLMSEKMARVFEARCLGRNTVGATELSGPLLFSEDDLPTYIIGITFDPPTSQHVDDDPERSMQEDRVDIP